MLIDADRPVCRSFPNEKIEAIADLIQRVGPENLEVAYLEAGDCDCCCWYHVNRRGRPEEILAKIPDLYSDDAPVRLIKALERRKINGLRFFGIPVCA